MKDYYSILGIARGASQSEVKKAFRALAQKHHPDKGGDEKKFKEISEAYAVLGDEKKRAQYDQFGSAGPGGFGGGQGFGGFDFSQFTQQGGFGGSGQGSQFEFDLGDIFGGAFGGAQRKTRRGRDIQLDIELTLSEALLGVEREITIQKQSTCKTCKGTGAKDGKTKKCSKCSGSGYTVEQKRTMFGTMNVQVPCSECQGLGEVVEETCGDCSGAGVYKQPYTATIKIPAGIQSGQAIQIRGGGEAVRSGEAGDLIAIIHINIPSNLSKDQKEAIKNLQKLGL